MKKFLEEFKAFALKGNMMDMAIGVLIGGAFSTLVTSLTSTWASVHSSLPSLTLSFWHSFCSVC